MKCLRNLLKSTLRDKYHAFIRHYNTMWGGCSIASDHGMVFQYRHRFAFPSFRCITFKPQPLDDTQLRRQTLREDLCDVLEDKGKVLRLVLDKPRVRELEECIEVHYPLRIFYASGGDDVVFVHEYPKETFPWDGPIPRWVLIAIDHSDFRAVRPWLCMKLPYTLVLDNLEPIAGDADYLYVTDT